MEDQPPPRSPTTSSLHKNKPITITASSISYAKGSLLSTSLLLIKSPCTSSPPMYILKDISFTAQPSQILALVGPSGAGKSTLLDIVAAKIAPTGGSLSLNNAPLLPSSFRKLSSYVPQHDYSLPMLTVYETFIFTAQLIKGSFHKSNDIVSNVMSVLSELGLAHLAHTKLGKGLSGGERRRVSIGLSLLYDPRVLILDEPTSGLDSRSAFKVMQTLKSTAESRGCTVVLSIHQPSFKILSIIDGILLLSKGRVVHHGTLSSLEDFLISKDYAVPPQLNSLEYAMELLNQISQHDGENNHVDSINKLVDNTPSPASSSSSSYELSPMDMNMIITSRQQFGRNNRSSRVHEVFLLYKRYWKIVFRTKQLLLTNTLEALVVGLVLGTIYIDIGYDKQGIEKRFGLFAFTLTFLLSSTTETLPIFINERPILIRETSSGLYHLSSYLVANTLVFMPYLFAVALIYSVSVYFLVGLCGTWQAFTYFVLVIWVIVLMANSFVLFLSALAPNYIAGTSLVTILLAGFFLFSGYFISKDRLPKFWLFMHYLSMYKYALDAMLINEYSCLVTRCLIWYDGDGDSSSRSRSCMVTGKDVMVKKGLQENMRWTNVYILLGFFVLYRLLCLFVLMRRVSRS